MANAEIEYKVPHVVKALHAILSELGVAKGGVLPQNMGGKPYITAADVAKEVKTLLVKNDLVVYPDEKITKHEIRTEVANRYTVAVGIEGTYTFESVIDGSTRSVTGAGDGLAGGTAVASNIASTNTMKNALLRTFMITEQSVEDAAKNGTETEAEQGPSQATRAVSKARGNTQAADTGPTEVEAARAEVKAAWKEVNGEDGGDAGYMALGKSKFSNGWQNRVSDLKALADAIRKGEVA